LQVSVNEYDEAVLTWDANIEPDIIDGGKYKIYRAEVWGTGEPTSWDLVAIIDAYNGSTPVTSWTDVDSYVYSGPRWLHYKISSLDNTLKESVPSDKVKINGRIPKSGDKNKNNILYTYELKQNYPNPFNPTTIIKYSIGNGQWRMYNVQLKVYDLLGREIAMLINEPKQAGEYEVEFDASNYGLSSGVYLYRLTSGSFSATRKFVYLR
jgi:hypothetical protein